MILGQRTEIDRETLDRVFNSAKSLVWGLKSRYEKLTLQQVIEILDDVYKELVK